MRGGPQARRSRACAKGDWRKCTWDSHVPHLLYEEDVAVGRLRYSDRTGRRLLHHIRAGIECCVQAPGQRGTGAKDLL